MSVMLSRLYAALRAAEVPDDKASAAAEEVAGYESRLGKIDAHLLPIKWMLGFNLAMTIAIVGKLFLK